MLILSVLIERKANSLNRPFLYYEDDKINVKKGERVAINFSNSKIIGFVIEVKVINETIEEYQNKVGYKINKIDYLIDNEPIINDELFLLADNLSKYYLVPLISIFQVMLPPSLKPKHTYFNKPKICYEIYYKVINDDESKLTNKQIELLRLIKNNPNISKKEIKSKSILNKLIENNNLVEYKKEKERFSLPKFNLIEDYVLNLEQENALKEIVNSNKNIHLLEGITGSGKTEIYIRLTKFYLNKGKNVLILVPEISLTSLMIERFASRFKESIAILHSELTDAEKYDEYRKIINNKSRIVIGVRSAIFAPLSNIGLIIIDEEHSESYKQNVSPFYHAVKVAEFRIKYHGAKLVLGSATPSLEVEARARKLVYNHIYLKKRINQSDLPKTHLVDMKEKKNLSSKSYLFSNLLINKINEKLNNNEQVILLFNRRGYSTSIYCRNCGEIIKCKNCNIPMVYHKDDNLLKCHHCGEVRKLDKPCEKCGSMYFYKLGFGIERIELETKKLFPNAKVSRIDSDVSKIKNNVDKILNSFKNNEINILIGTQMIAKGLDFPNVTLVGIVSADNTLSIPSFKSQEKTFNLITQAIGRSGRADKIGEAIIQSYNLKQYSIICGANQDYESFYKKEMEIRRITQYPPFTFLISVTLKSKDEKLISFYLSSIMEEIRNNNFTDVKVIGPSIPYISYQNDLFIRRIIIKYKKEDKIKDYLNNLLIKLRNKNNIIIEIDVDPFDI